jgi:WhiB family redox-sensing transcriptional regulator
MDLNELHQYVHDNSKCFKAYKQGLLDTKFFYPEGREQKDIEQRQQLAAKFCQGCVVQKECLDWAMATRQEYGVWGGHTEQQRKRLRKKRK